ncbi:hypothetical protein KKG81_02665 [bacterium]|jgi:hypothetical protein|nr:hypothetical protein [bacterium]
MEYGLIPKLNQFVDNRSLEVQKVQPLRESSEVESKNELKQLQQDILVKAKEVSNVEKTKTETQSASKYEVVLTNTNFGFNDSSKDFYVKAVRGNAENQYPTQDMMRVKAYLMNLDTSNS